MLKIDCEGEEYSIFENNPEMELEYFLSNYLTPEGEFYSSNNFYNNASELI